MALDSPTVGNDGVHFPRFKLNTGKEGQEVRTSPQLPLPASDDLMGEVLTQLKIMNAHLAVLSDVQINTADINGGM